jgi:hypothetical protein
LNSKKVFSVRSEATIWAEEFKSGSRVEMRAFKRSLQVMPPKASAKTAPKLELARRRQSGDGGKLAMEERAKDGGALNFDL